MADALDTLQRQRQIDLNKEVLAKNRNAQWAETFNSTPPTEVLRSRLDLNSAIDRAFTNKMNMAAQDSLKAQELKMKAAEYDEFQRLAPLREEKLRNQIQSAGAATRFAEKKDAETMNDVSSFMDYMEQAPDIRDPGYKSYMTQGVAKFPRVIGTQVGQDTLKRLNKEYVDVQSILPKEGEELDYIDFNDDGSVKARFKPVAPVVPQVPVPTGLVPVGATQGKTGTTVRYATPASEKTKDKAPDSYDRFNKDLEAAKKAYPNGLPATVQRAFEDRGQVLESATVGQPVPAAPAATMTRAEYEALPSGAEFVFNGRRGRKP